MGLSNLGGNMPDGGLFTPDQFPKGSTQAPVGQKPSRGCIEVKPPKDELLAVADSKQVSRYWQSYNQVLVTNLREFVLVGRDDDGNRINYEHFQLAATAKEFWAANPAKLASEIGDTFLDFLKRCLLRPAPVTSPKDVAWFLASYAREAKARVERASGLPALDGVRKAMEQALGVSFAEKHDPEKGVRFFRSTLVQTLFYGIFSAWVLWHKTNPRPKARFDWEKAAKFLRVPIIRKLFHELTEPGKLEEWKLDEVLGWAGDVLNRTDRQAFFSTFNDAEAVQYFYEPFLEQFDPDLRKQLGVWYTPPEIVKYMVERVDQVLKNDLKIDDGLAAENVVILDPCCGTGAYLVEVLRHIDATLKANGDDALRGTKLKEAALKRVFGFELLPAPFVVAHLQLGLALAEAGAALTDAKKERVGVYLTNALTGWKPPDTARQKVLFEELAAERDAAESVKQSKKVLVVLGNPPYNGFAGVAIDEERDLTNAYRGNPKDPAALKPQGQGLNDLYVRFFRMAERCIIGNTESRGVVSFISNYSWLDGLSFPVMRQTFLENFDNVWIDDLHGNRIASEYAPDGQTSETVFAVRGTSLGIKVGTAITTMTRKVEHKSPAAVHIRHWEQAKAHDRRAALLSSLIEEDLAKHYLTIIPKIDFGFPFREMVTEENYKWWPQLIDVIPTCFTGVKTARDRSLVSIDERELRERIETYFDKKKTNSEVEKVAADLMQKDARFEPLSTRSFLTQRGINKNGFRKYYYRPFDARWLYWDADTKLLDEKRTEYIPHVAKDNPCMVLAQRTRKGFNPPVVTSQVVSYHVIESVSSAFPLKLNKKNATLLEDSGSQTNISNQAEEYIKEIKGKDDELFFHVLATLHTPKYCCDNNDALRQDWPRVPLPNSAKLLKASGELGRQVAALLDPETPVDGVTKGKLEAALKVIAVPAKQGGGGFSDADYIVNARWGIAGQGGVCMPSTGKAIERSYTPEEKAALGDALPLLGETTFDVYLNERAYWRNVPANVWKYTLGGYQVLKKWLSYREEKLLGRPLKLDEVEHVRDTARRIAKLRTLGPKLDENYEAVKADLYDWPRGK
jgi:hypothetical protein